MLSYRVVYKSPSWEYETTVYGVDKQDAIKRAKLLCRKGYTVKSVNQCHIQHLKDL